MKILHIFPSLNLGGSQKRLIDLLKSDFGKKHTHVFLSMYKEYGMFKYIPDDVKYNIISPPKKNLFVKRIFAYRDLLNSLRVDVMLTYNWGAIEWVLANFPKIINHHVHLEDGFGPEEREKTFWRRDFFRCLALKNAQSVIVPSHKLMDIAKTKWKIAEDKLHYIPNGIDINLYRDKKAARQRLIHKTKLQEDAKFIGTIAGLRPEKNLSLMLESFSKLPKDLNAYLIIMGSGTEENMLKAEAKAFGIDQRTFFLGHIDKPWEYLPGLDIFLMTSVTEQMPYSIIEAMAAKLPIISTDVGDVKMMVSDKNKDFILDGTNAANIAKHLDLLLRDNDQCQKISKDNLQKSIGDFSIKKMIEEHLKIYQIEGKKDD